LTHSPDGEVRGLGDFGDRHPPVSPVFWSFRVMVGTGVLMLMLSWWTRWRLRRSAAGLTAPLARMWVAMTFAGWIATLAGWYVTEIGRQPYLVYGLLTARAAASAVPAPMIGLSLSMYLALYAGLLGAYVSVVFYLARCAGLHGPQPEAGSVAPPTALGATPRA
jgi:cytochrome d ubiquinol oxidase subunit I